MNALEQKQETTPRTWLHNSGRVLQQQRISSKDNGSEASTAQPKKPTSAAAAAAVAEQCPCNGEAAERYGYNNSGGALRTTKRGSAWNNSIVRRNLQLQQQDATIKGGLQR